MFVCLVGVRIVEAQSIKGPEMISYFQAPSVGVEFKYADVFIKADKVLEDAKREAAKQKNAAIGSKFGALGQSAASLANESIDYAAKMSKAIDELKDAEGRFAVWSFVPEYIIPNSDPLSKVVVEIFVLNDEDPSPNAGMMSPLTPDKEGYYDIPYYVNCRYRVSTQKGDLIFEDNLGVLSGTRKSKRYKAPAPSQGLKITIEESNELTESEKIGLNVAYNTVRRDVFARYGFGTFDAPIKLGEIKEIKESKQKIKPVLDVFVNKQGLLLNKDEKAVVSDFVNVIEKNIGLCSDKTRWVAFHNLSVCYAWLENGDKAKEYYGKYAHEIRETLDEMEKWNLLLQGKLPKEQRKGLVISMNDMKKFRNYNDIATFVNHYPVGAVRYPKLMVAINRDLKKFVDYYAHNDLLCQLYEIDYPFQFFPLQDFAGNPKKMEGTFTRKGADPITFGMKFDSKRRISQLETEHIGLTEDGKKEKLISRDLKPIYDEISGKHLGIEAEQGFWKGEVRKIYFSGNIKEIYDPLLESTVAKVLNITKKIGFWGDKTSDEIVQLKIDLDGRMNFVGNSRYFKANAIFRDVLSWNKITPNRTDTETSFVTVAEINENGVFTLWSWNGNVNTRFGAKFSQKEQSLTAKKMLREIMVLQQDERGNPIKLKHNFEMDGSLNIAQPMNLKTWFVESYIQGGVPKSVINKDSFSFSNSLDWDCEFKYDEQGNWIEMKVGPYTATRNFKY